MGEVLDQARDFGLQCYGSGFNEFRRLSISGFVVRHGSRARDSAGRHPAPRSALQRRSNMKNEKIKHIAYWVTTIR
jgi:hypothetical protein